MTRTTFFLFSSAFIVLWLQFQSPNVPQNLHPGSGKDKQNSTRTHDSVPTLIYTDDNGNKAQLRMNELKIDVEVVGNIARTTMEMTFENRTERILEGEINFPLAEGQTVTRFALDVNGKMRDGVPIEKQKGQQVFEAVVRENIDPGLLEQTAGNNFKARIYPIPANGYKRLIIAYEQELTVAENGNLYLLPLQFQEKLDIFKVSVRVFKQKIKPIFEQNELNNMAFIAANDAYIATFEQYNFKADKQLGFLLPKTDTEYTVFAEKSENATDNDYFYVNLKPEKYHAEKQFPRSICILFDVSTSMEKRNSAKEIELLDRYFSTIGNFQLTLITFSNNIHSSLGEKIEKGDWSQLKKQMENVRCDGATQFGCLDLNKIKCDEFILISDGMSNFGNNDIKLSKTPVNSIVSNQSADFSLLKYISAASGGTFVNLNKTTSEQALNKLTTQSYRFISAEFDDNTVSKIYPSIPTDFTDNFSISGQLKSSESVLKLNFGFGNRIVKTIKVRIAKDDFLNQPGFVSRIWAQKKIAELDMQYEKNKDEITATGKKYSIVTRNTSLIVLDRLEDYIQYEIVPPAEMQKEYFEVVEAKKTEILNTEKNHIDEVVQCFNTRINEWNRDFPKERPEIVHNNKEVGNGGTPIDSIANQDIIVMEVANEESVGNSSVENEPVDDLAKTEDKKESDKDEFESRQSSIQLNAWDPATPYMEKIKAASKENRYVEYLIQKTEFGSTPAFYLDAANYFQKNGDTKTALRILSNIAEMQTKNHELMRILAHRLEQLKYFDLAEAQYREVLKIRGEEPQSYRDLALCLAEAGKYADGLEIVYNAVKKNWDDRFPEIECIMAFEMNRIIARADGKIDVSKIDSRLIKSMPVDMRIVLNWDTDNSDMDLWVTDPYGEKCFYGAPLSYTGGHMSRDFTRGYGPEEFWIKKAISGKYIVQANYYGSSEQRITGPTTIYLELYTNYGRKDEKRETITMQLESQAAVVDIARFEFGK